MIWRLRMHRLRRMQDRFAKWARIIGIAGAGAAAFSYNIGPLIGIRSLSTQTWPLALLGISLVLGGFGHALHGDNTSVREYAEGESEEMPSIGKFLSGLAASAGGVAVLAVGVLHIFH